MGSPVLASDPASVRSYQAPNSKACVETRPSSWRATTGTKHRGAPLRVFAIQFKQDVEHVRTYATFRRAMRCLMHEFVEPYRRAGQPTLVVFPEDVGLATLATGRRGRAARAFAATPLGAPVGDAAPAGGTVALQQLAVEYAPQVAAYRAMYPDVDPRRALLLAATDTSARAVSQTFSDIARDFGVYVVASNNQAGFRETHDPAEVALFGDPDVDDGTAYVATSGRVPNRTFLWGPDDIDPAAPQGTRNLIFTNQKVPLTPLEIDLLGLSPGPSRGRAGIRNAAGAEVAGFRLGFATSLPAFTYGTPFGRTAAHPCRNTARTYMHCMEARGVDVVVQAEANPGRWAGPGGRSDWQPLEWMDSTWRSVADPAVSFDYNITAHMVGNLFDLAFDGQTAITARHERSRPRQYVGNRQALRSDPARFRRYAGAKRHFVQLVPWVCRGPAAAARDRLRACAAERAPGSGSPLENDYLQTAVFADMKHHKENR